MEDQANMYTTSTKDQIASNLDNPRLIEKMYQENKTTFIRDFNLVYPDIRESTVAQVWHARLNFEAEEISWGTRGDWIFVVVASIMAGLIAEIPQFAGIDPEYFYPRHLAFIVFPLLTFYFAWKRKLSLKNWGVLGSVMLLSALYMNILPHQSESATLLLACIHLPLFLWTWLGFAFIGSKFRDHERSLDFLRYNGDLLVMMTIILIAGGLLTGITLGLFRLIDLNIEKYYFQYVVIWGLAAAPIVGTYLVQANPHLVNKVSPVIAKVFTPLVLVTLVIYLAAVIVSGKDPYNDREFLLIFNLLLIGVMAIIIFSVAETSKKAEGKGGLYLLFSLAVITAVINGIALSAIIFRISEWGISPNRLAILGGNILILTHLLIVTFRLFITIRDRTEMEKLERSIVFFLPIYGLWAALVTFVFPLVFGFK